MLPIHLYTMSNRCLLVTLYVMALTFRVQWIINRKFINGGHNMEKIFHPVSGESGYFTTEQEKVLIDAIIHDYNNQLVVTSANGRGVANE